MAKALSIIVLATHKAALADAFNEWARRYEADPEEFGEIGGEDYGENCAEYLVLLLNEAAS